MTHNTFLVAPLVGGAIVFWLSEIETLRWAIGELTDELGAPVRSAEAGERIDGMLRRRLDLVSGRFTLVEQSREFTPVPWRPALE